MEDDQEFPDTPERYALKIWVNKGETLAWMEERWFVDRPAPEIAQMLLEEAKRTFVALYPGNEPDDLTVNLFRLRPADGAGAMDIRTT